MPSKSAIELFEKMLKENNLCVLATSSKNGKPEASTIKYAEDKDYNLFFETLSINRKYQNIQENPIGSIVITEIPNSIQMDGILKELIGKDAMNAKEILIKKNGKVPKIFDDPNIRFFKFIPNWIRLRTKIDGSDLPKFEMIFEK